MSAAICAAGSPAHDFTSKAIIEGEVTRIISDIEKYSAFWGEIAAPFASIRYGRQGADSQQDLQ